MKPTPSVQPTSAKATPSLKPTPTAKATPSLQPKPATEKAMPSLTPTPSAKATPSLQPRPAVEKATPSLKPTPSLQPKPGPAKPSLSPKASPADKAPVVTPSPIVTPKGSLTPPPDAKHKLQPVPLPWQKPVERLLKPDPAVLLVGADEAFLPAIEKALGRHKVFVETTDVHTIVETVVAAAPDLVMLMGEAALDCGNDILRKLAASPQSAVVPVVILDDNTVLDARLRAFRHGAAAVIPRSASVDAIADQVATLAREIPERHGAALGEVGDTTLKELVETLATQLRSGILSVSTGRGDDAEAVRLVLGQGRPLAELIDDFVARARKHVLAAEPLHYEFSEHVSGTLRMLDVAHADQRAGSEDLGQVRIALADSDAARADNIAQELRALGATVIVTDLSPNDVRFTRMRQVDPTILLIGEGHLQGEGYDLVRRMRQDTRLRWASLLVVRWAELWAENDAAPKTAVQRLAGTLAALAEPENSVRERAQAQGFDTRLEITGPARCLRALTASGNSIRATVTNARLSVELDIGNQLVVGATAATADGLESFEGATALAAFMQLSSGRVSVEPVQHPATANVMTTIDVALNMADAEPPPIAPSLPAAPGEAQPSIRPAKPAALPSIDPSTGESPAAALAPEFAPVQPEEPVRAPSIAAGSGGGIRPLTAAILVALAAVQGLLFVVIWRALTREAHDTAPAAKAAAPALAPPARAMGAGPSERGATPRAALRAAPPAFSGTSPFPVADGSDADAPTCEELWASEPPRAGNYPGAAFQQSRAANKWITRGDLDQAQHAYCLAVRWDDQNVGFLVGLGHLLLLRRDGDQAVPILRRALELNPESTRAHGLLGDALARTGDYDAARAHWLQASGYQPGDEKALRALGKGELNRADEHLKRRELVHAERLFRRAALSDSKSLPAVLGLSRSLTELGDPKAAAVWAKYAVSLDPRSAPARIELGDALAKQGETAAAKIEYQEAQLLDPTSENARKRIRGEE